MLTLLIATTSTIAAESMNVIQFEETLISQRDAHYRHREVDIAMAGDEQHGQFRIQGLHPAEEFQPVHARHPDVEEYRIRTQLADSGESGLAVGSDLCEPGPG